MRQIITTVTSSGQVTLPAEVRRLLGVGPRDRVAFTIEDSIVRVVPVKGRIASLAGSMGPATRTEDIERMLDEAKEEMAARIVEKMKSE